MNYLKLNKKANLFNNITIVIVGIFTIIIGAFVTRLVYEGIMQILSVVPEFQTASHQKAIAGFNFAISMFDGLIFFSSLMFIVGVIFFALKVPEDSVFFIVLFVIAPFMGIFAYFFSYLGQQIIGDVAFNTISLYFPLSILILSNFHWLALLMLVVGGVAKYYKRQNQAGEVLI